MSKRNEVSIPRRFLPPFAWLASFEAVARRGSVTTAAHELNLTQGAVSRHVQKLEQQIGVQLFERDKQRLHLTGSGKILCRRGAPRHQPNNQRWRQIAY